MSQSRQTTVARGLRQRMDMAESLVWDALRAGKIDGLKFLRQHPVSCFYVDFACERLPLVIELDGGVHRLDAVAARDAERQGEIEALGWTVIRFDNSIATGSRWRILDAIRAHARAIL